MLRTKQKWHFSFYHCWRISSPSTGNRTLVVWNLDWMVHGWDSDMTWTFYALWTGVLLRRTTQHLSMVSHRSHNLESWFLDMKYGWHWGSLEFVHHSLLLSFWILVVKFSLQLLNLTKIILSYFFSFPIRTVCTRILFGSVNWLQLLAV